MKRNQSTSTPSWDFLNSFFCPTDSRMTQRWQAADDLFAAARPLVSEQLSRILALADEWDCQLQYLGGDPIFQNWESFRPMRLSREEDWTDWLSHLCSESTGPFLSILFDLERTPKVLEARREELSSSGARRADLVLVCDEGAAFHIEVKVADRNFAKTPETARAMKAKFEHHCGSNGHWRDYILLPDTDIELWAATLGNLQQKDASFAKTMGVLPWSRVDTAIRMSLWSKSEGVSWSTWAAAFCGNIEQKLLGFRHLPRAKGHKKGISNLQLAWTTHLIQQLEDGKLYG